MSDRAVARERLRLQEVLACCGDAITEVDQAGLIREWNEGAERVFGWSRGEALGSHISLIWLHEAEASRFAALERGEDVPPFETVRRHRDGSGRRVRVTLRALREDDEFVGVVGATRDLGEEAMLARGLALLLSTMPVEIATFDSNGVVTSATGGHLVPGSRLLELAPGTDFPEAVRAALAGGTGQAQLQVGGQAWQVRTAPLEDPEAQELAEGPLQGLLVALESTQRADRLDTVLSSAPLCLTTFDPEGRVTYAAGAGFRRIGIEPHGVLDEDVFDLAGHTPAVVDAVRACLAGETRDVVADVAGRRWALHYKPILAADGTSRGGIALAQDVAARPDVDVEVRAVDRLDVDGVTDLLGLQRRLAEPLAPGLSRYVGVVDVDRFDLVHDTHGAEAADHLLHDLVRRVRALLPEHVVVGAWHADQLVLVLDQEPDRAGVEELCLDVLDHLRDELRFGDLSLHLTGTVGVADSDQVDDVAGLLGPAQVALRIGKRDGGDVVRWFEPGMAQAAGSRVALLNDLRRVVRAEDFSAFSLHLQPIVELTTRRVASAEALLRWTHPARGPIGPDRFVDLAESSGLMGALGGWVLREACAIGARLQQVHGRPLSIAVNLSAQELTQPRLVELVQDALAASGLPARLLTIEVTERSVSADIGSTVAQLTQLKELGVRIALDDYGTGYSSLFYLKHFPVDILKIDHSFVSGLGHSDDDLAIVAATVSMAKTLGVACVAEGIETMEQFRILKEVQCRFGQGYAFSRPLTSDAFADWLTDFARPADATPDWTSLLSASDVSATILELVEEGASLHTIAGALNSAGHRNPKGHRWSAQAVARVVAASQYAHLPPARPLGRPESP